MLKAMSKFQGVLKMFMLGVLKTILKTVLKYEKNTITLYGTCWNWAADFVFLLRFCTSNWSETYIYIYIYSFPFLHVFKTLLILGITSFLNETILAYCTCGFFLNFSNCHRVPKPPQNLNLRLFLVFQKLLQKTPCGS